jgi:FKBP-type peptidyl-prolyl cis-trans isomerase
VSSSNRYRLLNQMARNAAWTSSAWLAVMAGCVEAPQESFTPVEVATTPAPAAVAGELSSADQAEPVGTVPDQISVLETAEVPGPQPFNLEPDAGEPQPTLVAETATSPGLFPIPEHEPLPEPAEGVPAQLNPDGGVPVSSSAALDAATPQIAADDSIAGQQAELVPETEASPTLAEEDAGQPSPSVPAPFPGSGDATTSLEPEPESAAPTLADDVVDLKSAEVASPQPVPAPGELEAAEPALNANANPVDPTRPKGYIHINPRPRTPENAAVPNGNVNQNAVGKIPPAVVLPPSAGADAASLAPLPGSESTEQDPVAEPATKGIPVSPVSIGTSVPDSSADIEIPEGFTALFNNQDLTGWEVIDGKADSWEFKNGVLSCVAPGGGWVQTLAMYSDFELRFQYQLSAGGNSGVSLRYPGHGNPSLEGLEIQLIDDQAEKYADIQPQQATGSLYFASAPQIRDAAHPAGTWNHCAVRCVGQRLEVTINDKLVNEIDLSQINTRVDGETRAISAVRSPMGAIALQSHSTRVNFRGVMIRDLTQSMASGVRWLDLQEGAGDAVTPEARVTVHYIAHLSTGKRFANSVEKNKPVTVELRDVIPGWREGIPGMKVGGKRRLVVPPAMAYGEKGFKEVVPPNSTLVYEIELLEFEPAVDELPQETAEASSSDSEVK